ncbi:MAG: hypothetical protein ACTFAL_02975 [Candidatus Electronema sp. V4]|uniref:hypothetical protein n=1 Tax=Candidatus Electronema sp. V4 TaxID=3454756 RepID=UPI0040559AA5
MLNSPLSCGSGMAGNRHAFPSSTVGRVTAPEPLAASHETGGFACGVPSLDDWLKKQALKNEVSGASRIYAVCESGSAGWLLWAESAARCLNPYPWLFWAVSRLTNAGIMAAAARHVGIRAL